MGNLRNEYTLHFSKAGILFYTLQLFPNIIWRLFPPAVDILAANTSPYPLLDGAEWVLGILVIALLMLINNRDKKRNSNTYLWLALGSMAAYYLGWVCYLLGVAPTWLILTALVAMPPVCFLLAGIWLKNYTVVVPSVLFFLCHVSVFAVNYL